MEVTFYFKSIKRSYTYVFPEEEFEKFERDFIEHASSKSGKPGAGSYICQKMETDGVLYPPRKLPLRFDEVVLN
jgi:hypothetical protein